jgi:chemotaxis protein methyltransferase CheR
MSLEMTPQLFAIFSSLVEEACGLHYGPGDRELFASKVAAQAVEAGFDSLLDYYYRIRYDDPDGAELRALVQVLLVHETYFFRELPPLIVIAGLLADRVAAFGRARVWSAACSTGEEPLTLAMLLAERGILDRVDVLATDLSEQAIQRARENRHSRRSLRAGHPVELAQRYLDATRDGVAAVPAIKEAVRFGVLNLLDARAVARLGVFDAILCRNVLIYFRDEQIVRVVERLRSALAPAGVLAVGVSESLLRFGTTLACEERSGVYLYRSVA